MGIWKVALLLPALCWGQSITVIAEPLGEATAKRTLGTNYTLWRVYPSTLDLAATSIPRGAVTSITPIAEIPSKMARDIVTKGAGTNKWTLLGRGWDEGSPLASGALGAIGWAADSRGSIYAGAGITVISLIRRLLKGQAPTPAIYAEDFLPETIPCNKGTCGEWFVLTERVAEPKRVVIGAVVSTLDSPVAGVSPPYGCHCGMVRHEGIATVASFDDLDDDARAALADSRFRRMMGLVPRERTTAMGAGQ